MSSVCPIFDISESDQVLELNKYLSFHKIKTPVEEIDCNNWPDVLLKILPGANTFFCKEDVSPENLNDLLLTVATIILQINYNSPILEKAITLFCDMYTGNLDKFPDRVKRNLFSLDFLFRALPEDCHARYRVYLTILECGHKLMIHNQIITDLDFIENWMKKCECTKVEARVLWRKLYEYHVQFDDCKKAFSSLIPLLNTFDDSDADNARDDAIKCILTAIKDPNIVIYDHLLSLSPIQFIEGEPIHDLLQIFVSGDMKAFEIFAKKNTKLIADNGLSEKALLDKIRLLNFMQMCESVNELAYEDIKKSLNIKSDEELREFVINIVRLKCVVCKLDELNKKVLIVSALPRSFGPEQWKNLLNGLTEWKTGIDHVHESLRNMLNSNEN